MEESSDRVKSGTAGLNVKNSASMLVNVGALFYNERKYEDEGITCLSSG